ncbi:hypothetical protein M0638_12825 [Roseomonas sp. NAR14]|uniref:Alpha/beta hydrolase domain-containing protein n=1 Tax=Roseomonas acroporae TaxID=2937791 RepID=A0A9X1Y6U1_9PROT|nr:alpha/beta hydrolase domain-containing protein [Roseomonas acroporae]MCK8785269.1 hypothetical protein [Roseomonas acroporae]
MRWPILLLLAATAAAAPAKAEVTRFDVTSRQSPALGGRSFGPAGTAERITGRATIALDPADPRNAVIADLALAPRNAEGRVEAATDVVILRPQRPNGTLLFEVLNRGRKLVTSWTQDTESAAGIRLERPDDAGNGFLLEQGFTLVWAEWQADSPAVPGALRLAVPTVPGVTGPSREEWSFADTASPKRVRLSYPIADRAGLRLTVRDRADAPRATPEGLGLTVIDDDTVEIARPSGAAANALYELTYTARDPRVMGMGLAVIRDVTAFLRYDTSAANPLAARGGDGGADGGRTGIARAIGLGISQSGRVLRDFLYFGMNRDERGRQVFEGAMPIIPGARRSFLNARFAQPGRNPGPEFDRLYPVLQFPFTYPVLDDPLSGRRDGILLRCRLDNSCPRLMQMDSEFEFWGSQASLLVTDPQGFPVAMPADVRLYMLAGAPHGNLWNAVARRNPACALPVNPQSGGPVLRALIVAMQDWIATGAEPSASRYPRREEGTLVPAGQALPAIPGLGYRAQYARANLIEPNPNEQGAGVPAIRGEYPLFLPRAGLDGNAIAGIRQPLLAVPRATYTGWNPIAGADGPQDLCTQLGGVLPLPATAAEARAAGDPRPTLEALYPTPESYVEAVRAAAAELLHARLLLPRDAEAAVAAARDGTLARLGR